MAAQTQHQSPYIQEDKVRKKFGPKPEPLRSVEDIMREDYGVGWGGKSFGELGRFGARRERKKQTKAEVEAELEELRRSMQQVKSADEIIWVRNVHGEMKQKLALAFDGRSEKEFKATFAAIVGIMIASGLFVSLWLVAPIIAFLVAFNWAHKQYKMMNDRGYVIHLPRYTGWGTVWQKSLSEILDMMDEIHEKVDKNESMSQVVGDLEPIIWETVKSIEKLLLRLHISDEMDDDAKQALLNQYRKVDRFKKDIREILKECNSLELLKVNVEVDTEVLPQALHQVQETLAIYRELEASTSRDEYEDDDDEDGKINGVIAL